MTPSPKMPPSVSMRRTVRGFQQRLVDNLYHTHGQAVQTASLRDAYMALSYSVRDQLIERWRRTTETHFAANPRFVYYLSADEVIAHRERGYDPMDRHRADDELRNAIDSVAAGRFSEGDGELFKPIVESLLHHDEYMLLADYASYVECSERAARAYRDPEAWARMSILNTARCGFFSSDRSMRQYCNEIWNVDPVKP